MAKTKTTYLPKDVVNAALLNQINPAKLPYYLNHPKQTAPTALDPNSPDKYLLRYYANHPTARALLLGDESTLPYYLNHPKQKAPAVDQNNPDPHLINFYKQHPNILRPGWVSALLVTQPGNGPGNLPAPDDPTADEEAIQEQQIGPELGEGYYRQLAPLLGANPSNVVGQAHNPGWQDIGFPQLRHDISLPVPTSGVNMGVAV